MAESLRLCKRQNTGESSVKFFKDFLSDENNAELISMLRSVLYQVGIGFGHSSVFFLRVKATNANSCVNFSKASVDVDVHRHNSFPLVAPLVLFFAQGYAVLADFLDEDKPAVPEDTAERHALEDLLQFLANRNEQSVITESKDKNQTESELAVRFAQHLLVPLASCKSFVIDSSSSVIDAVRCCPSLHPMNGVKGDTSFGCPSGWHGCADIMLTDSDLPVTVVECVDNIRESDAVSSDSSSDVEKDDIFTPDTITQVTAQTIVYSFVQHQKRQKSPTSMVPGIGFCAKKLIVYLYDCVEDILLTTGPVSLYAQIGERSLDPRAVIILWLTLNYRLFGNKIPDTLNSYKSCFHHVIGPVQLEAYKTECMQPCRLISDQGDLFKFWAEENVSFRFNIKNYLPDRKSIPLK